MPWPGCNLVAGGDEDAHHFAGHRAGDRLHALAALSGGRARPLPRITDGDFEAMTVDRNRQPGGRLGHERVVAPALDEDRVDAGLGNLDVGFPIRLILEAEAAGGRGREDLDHAVAAIDGEGAFHRSRSPRPVASQRLSGAAAAGGSARTRVQSGGQRRDGRQFRRAAAAAGCARRTRR